MAELIEAKNVFFTEEEKDESRPFVADAVEDVADGAVYSVDGWNADGCGGSYFFHVFFVVCR